ncbi:MAG: hypothetical protein ACRCZP_02280, partial [Phycicoccus sp.]
RTDRSEDTQSTAVWVFLLAVLLVAIPDQYLLERFAGAEPRLHWARHVVLMLTVLGLTWAAARWGAWLLAVAVALLGAGVGVPVWSASGRERPPSWPAGAEAFATLAVLAPARWVHPRRLAELTVMPEVTSQQWVGELAFRGLVSRGGFSGGHSWTGVHLTSAGRDQLARWRADLGRLALEPVARRAG